MEENNVIEQTESIDFKLNAKGKAYWDIKVRDKQLTEESVNRIKSIHDKLIEKFPNNVISSGE